MTSHECQHPFSRLKIDGGSVARGAAPQFMLECLACKNRMPGGSGVKALVEALQAENRGVWDALHGAGVSRDFRPSQADFVPQPEPATQEQAQDECPHYLGWLKIDSSGLNVRSAANMIWFRCAGCEQRWNQAAGLVVWLSKFTEDQNRIRAALRTLGLEI